MSKKVTGKYNRAYCGKVIISKTNSTLPHHKRKRIRKNKEEIFEVEFTLLDLFIELIKSLFDLF